MLLLLATVNHAQVPPGAAGGNPMMPQGFPTPEPVSYTHLTLPTKA